MYSETLVLHRLSLPVYGMAALVALTGFFYWLFMMATLSLEIKALLYFTSIIVFGVVYSDLWVMDTDSISESE